MVVFLGEEVAQDTGGVATADLVGGQGKVNALDEVPQLCHRILAEHPEWDRTGCQGDMTNGSGGQPELCHTQRVQYLRTD
jgi:hypothetical protein